MQQDLLAQQDPQVLRVQLVLRVTLVILAAQDPKALLDPQDHVDHKVSLVQPDLKELLVEQVQLVQQELMDNLE